jgi:hypothetical protein
VIDVPFYFVPFISTESDNACVQVHPTHTTTPYDHVANVWFPAGKKPFVSSNRSGLSKHDLIISAQLALKAKRELLL